MVAHSSTVTPSANRKVYDGSIVVSHFVQEGQTLSKIAAIYRIRRWESIWIYNTKIEKILDDNPNLIRKGITILIPRSAAAYDKLIRKLKALGWHLEADAQKIAGELESNYYELKANKELFNFAGDVLTIVGTLGLKLASAAKLAVVAEASKGQAKLATRLAANYEGRQLAEQLAEARARHLATALKDHRKLRASEEWLREFYRGKGIDAVTKVADNRLQQALGQEDISPAKHAKNLWAAKKVITHHSFSITALADTAEIVLDYIEPAGLAEQYLRLTTGETAEGTIERLRESVKSTADANIARIERRIEKLKWECNLLYA